MKLRSLLLAACMIVVPALAMFSHLIPPGVRTATRSHLVSLAESWFGVRAEAGPPPAAEARPATQWTAPPPAPTPGTGTPTTEADPAQGASPPPALVAQLADRTRNVRDQQARELQAIETRLKAWGAVTFDCQPLPGPDGLFSSGCRVPVDASGQLQRVFQATGHDSVSAAEALLEQVASWRRRNGASAASTAFPSAAPDRAGSPDRPTHTVAP